MNNYDVIVVGSGPAGFAAATTAARRGKSVVVLERNEKLARKVGITGKGRCNVTNACGSDEFFSHIFRNPKFMFSSFKQFSNIDMMDLLSANGLELKVVGVIRPKEGVAATAIRGTVGYTKELTEYVITETDNSEILCLLFLLVICW